MTGKTEVPNEALSAAAAHGAQRARQGYTVPLLCTETRILNRVIGVVLQQNLLSMNLSTLIPEALKIGEYLQALLEESIRTFQETEIPPQLSLPRSAGAVRRVRQNRSR